MKKFHAFVACLFTLRLASGAAAVDPNRYLEDVKYLASPQLRGRASGSPELEKAGHFIASQFHAFGLKPIDGKSYLQAFTVTTNAKLGPANRFEYSLDGHATELKFREDFIPFIFSSRAQLTGTVVFAGYGITAPEYGYDDYAGIDAKGKIVLILRHEPQEFDEKSVFEGKVYTEHAQFFSKASNAKAHGAAGVILINDRAAHRGDPDELEKFGASVGPGDAGIPYVQIKAEVAERWFTGAHRDLEEVQGQIDKDLHPRSFEFAGLVIDANLDLERAVKTVHNVAGFLPGSTDEYVVIGAHYDHLGLGEQFSMAPSKIGTIHPGADDNASGTAGVIELARWYAKQPKQKRGILFLCFAGEELGLLGSSYYVSHPTFPLERAVAMINMDMIGRIRDSKVFIGGVGSGSNLKATIEEIQPKYQLRMDFSDSSGYGSSDHTSFTTKQVPVLFFFSGLHSDYHRPSDTWDKIDAPGAVKLLALVSDVTDRLRTEAVRPMFVRVNQAGPHGGAVGSSSAGAATGYGPYFGSIPDFTELPNGVRFADVREGSPAGKAGLRGGDVLVEFDGKPVQNLYDFTYALRARKPGDEVQVKVLREKETVSVKVLLEKRRV
jgi:hypothetical protein